MQIKKIRHQEGLFLAEGLKLTEELLASDYQVAAIVIREGTPLPPGLVLPEDLCHQTDSDTFQRLSTQVNPEGVLTVARIPGAPLCLRDLSADATPPGPALVLAAIQDPGNLGTIIRTSEWFGLGSVVLGPGTVDPFNPKVARSAMGSLFRTPLHLVADLKEWATIHAHEIWCADMDGEPLNEVNLSERPYILLGNESLGVPAEVANIPGLRRVTIPRIGKAESLNAATAAAVFAWHLRFGKP
ncbi:MAG: TrmH family RNA methyltransferase [Bacteroidia bacterium]